MFYNHLKVAVRYLLHHKTYALTNIAGLTLGLGCFLLLNSYIGSEKNFDGMNPGAYRLLQKITDSNGLVRESAASGSRVGAEANAQFPEIESVTQIMEIGRLTVGNDPDNKNYEGISTIDSNFFEVFGFKLKEGDPAGAFSQPNGAIVQEKFAKKYFGDQSALGKTLKTNVFECTITGVLEDFPENSHFQGQLMVTTQLASANFRWWDEFMQTNWNRNSLITYFKVRPDADIPELGRKITAMAKSNWPKDAPFTSEFFLQPVQDIHLYAHDVEGEINNARGNAFYIRLFFWIALVILLVACFNYAGLLNVAFLGRSREIGVRKAVGAGKGQLLNQFFLESALLTGVALVLAIVLLNFLQPLIARFLGTSFSWSHIPAIQIAALGGIGFLVSLLAIVYPGWMITRVAAVQAMKNENNARSGFSFRKGITVFQFATAIALIGCSFLFYRQINYLQSKEMGFNKDGMVIVDINSRNLRSQFEAIKAEFSKLPEVQSVSVTSRVPGEWKNFPLANVKKRGQSDDQRKEMIFIGADQDFLNTYGISLLNGANFSGSVASDTSKVLINATAAKTLGFENPVGQWIEIPSVNWSGDNNPLDRPMLAQVAGVVRDFHFEDVKLAIKPMVIGFWQNPIHNIDYYSIKVSTSDWPGTLASLKKINDSFDSANPLEYNILNDRFERFYEADILRSRLLLFFSGIVIFIACLGLLVMTAFTLRNRTKEIGVRKVLGASSIQIIQLISREFTRTVGIAFLIGMPLAWYAMNQWMAEFAYHIPMDWLTFLPVALGAGIFAVLIALATISLQSIRAAFANPVDSLRDE
ncbi:MAG: ABC transporter permease [Lewinellaceae bacterium]|nr:ABC transporter permease [Lewinella sp.]MCB9280006.1 ABC transporter permease [Lewinellaceae bacterium]